jgi:Fe-Mn family superoxide dismutase
MSLISRVVSRYRVAKSLLPGGAGRRMHPSDFNAKELEMGIKVEQEHLMGARYSESDARLLAQEIAMDHLTEVLDYYTRLKAVEGEAGPNAAKKDKRAAYFNAGDPIRAPAPPVRGTAVKVAARYKEKKKVKTKDGDEATVYVYSERQVANRNREKAERIDTLRKNHAGLLDQIKKDLDSGDAKTRLTALALGLIDNTYERVGNDDSADDGHFGVTGWQKKHLTFSKGKVVIKYVGKSGVKHEKIVSDSDLLRVLKDCCEDKDPDDPIFGFPDEEGGTKVTARDVNDYLAEYDITAKDLRGYHANREMQERLREIRKKGPALPRDRKGKDEILKAEFTEALEAVAEAVGHEPSTLRSQYLVPWLEDTYLKNGDVIDRLDKQASFPKRSDVIGDGSSVGLFIPLPPGLASQYEVKGKDPSPPHVTLLVVGPVPPEREEELVEIVERFVTNRPAPIAVINGSDAFIKDDGSSVVYSRIQFANDMKAIRDLIWGELDGEGFNVQHSFPSFHPHTTIEYRDEVNPVFTGKLPTGSWICDRIEIWGLPKKRTVKFAPVRVAKKASVGKHTLPPLPYAYDALEPHISEETLRFHHDKHHKAYVDGLNKAEKQIAAARADEDWEAIPAFNLAMEFNAGGHILHDFYWKSLTPTEDYTEPSKELVEAIETDFGSWDAFRSQLKESTIKVRGSGWGVLVSTPNGLRVLTVMNHENGVLWDGSILLPIDAWEHAYYLDYQNDREAHFDAVFDNLVNWPEVERRLGRSRDGSAKVAKGKAKKDVGHGGLDEWFSGHGGATGKGEEARWGDWVAISPVKKTLDSGKKVEPGDIVGPCGISDDPDWEDATKDGKDPLKCMPREKAHDMPKRERAEKARAKMRTERSEGDRGKKPTYTPTFDKKADSENEPTNENLWERSKAMAKERYGKWPSAYAVGHALKIYKEEGGGWRKKKASYGSLNDKAQAILDRGSHLWPLDQISPPLVPPPADDSKTTANEVVELVRFSRERPVYQGLIKSLDRDFPSAFLQLCAQLGVPCDEHRIEELVEGSKPVILALKVFYDRSRPFQVSPDIHPIASNTTQTPSYPSAHTAQAWLIARDLATRFPEHREAFFDLARLVAKTRLLAGVHFRSDIEYAEVLAAYLHGFLAARTSRTATKTEGERQDDEAERLVKPAPKNKPPRKDLKRRRVQDSDTTTDADADQDRKDRSQNYKDARLEVGQKWKVSDPTEADPSQADRLWDLYLTSYGSIGVQAGSPRDLLSSFELMFYRDLDGDQTIDTFVAFKRTPAGSKLIAMGSDGTSQGKRAALAKAADLLGKVGWYSELSGKPAQTMLASGLQPVKDEQTVRDVIRKPLTWKGDGAYERVITGLGNHEKFLFGRPRVRVASFPYR